MDFLDQLDAWGLQHSGSLPTTLGQTILHWFDPHLNNLAASFFIGLSVILIAIMTVYTIVAAIVDNIRFQRYIRQMVHSEISVTPEDFMAMRASGRVPEFAGVYVIHNLDDDMYYVGQSIHVIFRVNQHLTGKGNGDVYADYKYGRRFQLFLVPLGRSGFPSLNSLEKATIKAFHAFDKGYNKTRGNAG